MRKIFVTLTLLLTCSVAVMAQTVDSRYATKDNQRRGFGLYLGADRDTLQYIVASPFDNWYLEGGIGGQTYIGNEFEDSARWNKLDYNFYVELGKWVIPDVAVALNFSAYGMHGQTRYGPHPWTDFTGAPTMSLSSPTPGTYYAYQPFFINGMSLTGLVYIEWTNLFNGYEQGDLKKLHVMTPVGLGYSMLYGGQRNPRGFDSHPEGSFRRNFELHFMAGMTFEYRATKALTLHANAHVKVARGSLDTSPTVSLREQQSGIFDFMPTVQVGLRINMLKRVTKVDPRTGRTYTALVNHQFLPASTERITYLENRIDTLVVQMQNLAENGDFETAANLAAVRDLNHQLDSLQRLLSTGGNSNATLLAQIAASQAEIDKLIQRIAHGRKELDLPAAEALVARQSIRQDSLDMLMGRLVRLQSDLDKGIGNPTIIKVEISKILSDRDRLLENADGDNYDYGIDDEQGLYTPLDASQTAYRHVLYNDLLARLYRELAKLQKQLDSKEFDRNAVDKQLESVRAEMANIQNNLTESGKGLSDDEMLSILARQRARRDTLSRLSDKIIALQIGIATGKADNSNSRAELARLRYEFDHLVDVAEKDNRLNLIDNEQGELTPYVAAQAASDQAAIRNSLSHVGSMVDHIQTSMNSYDMDPQEILRQIQTAQRVLDSINNAVDVGGDKLTPEEATALLARQQSRMATVASLDRQMAALQKKIDSGVGNVDDLKAEIKRLNSLRQDVMDQAEDDNLSHGVRDDHGNLCAFESAQLAAKRVSYKSLLDALDRKMAELQYMIEQPGSPKEEIREQINVTKSEIDYINKKIGDNGSNLTIDQLKAHVAEQQARQDSIAYIDRRIASLEKRLERGNGDPRLLADDIAQLKAQRAALRSKSKKANADNHIDNANNTLGPLVAAETALDQSNLRNRLGYIRSMLDALLRNLGGANNEQAILQQIADIQSHIDSIVVAGHIDGAGMMPSEADSLVLRQQARLDSIADIDRRIRELNRLADRGQGDPDEIQGEIDRLAEERGNINAEAEKDNRSHGVGNGNGTLDPLAAAREAARQSHRLHQLDELTLQLDSLQALLDQERRDADPMAQINDAILQLDLPMARVYYQLDKYDLDYNARKTLHDFALKLKRAGTDAKYYIIGAADAQTGTPSHNKWLSGNRCKAVYDVLVRSYGVPESQLEMFPLGGITEFEQQENNRTAIIVLSNHEITSIIEKWNRINEANNTTKKK